MSKLDELINLVEDELKYFKNPTTYQEEEYYIKMDAKADYAELILARLKKLKKD